MSRKLKFHEIGQEERVVYTKVNVIFDHISLSSSKNDQWFRKKKTYRETRNTHIRFNIFFRKLCLL